MKKDDADAASQHLLHGSLREGKCHSGSGAARKLVGNPFFHQQHVKEKQALLENSVFRMTELSVDRQPGFIQDEKVIQTIQRSGDFVKDRLITEGLEGKKVKRIF